jgi:hypothetical protein
VSNNTTINVGDTVRSYDFDGRNDCYVEGTVVRMGDDIEGCPRYVIRVSKTVFKGEVLPLAARYVNPPLNGTPKLFGGFCCGVVKA